MSYSPVLLKARFREPFLEIVLSFFFSSLFRQNRHLGLQNWHLSGQHRHCGAQTGTKKNRYKDNLSGATTPSRVSRWAVPKKTLSYGGVGCEKYSCLIFTCGIENATMARTRILPSEAEMIQREQQAWRWMRTRLLISMEKPLPPGSQRGDWAPWDGDWGTTNGPMIIALHHVIFQNNHVWCKIFHVFLNRVQQTVSGNKPSQYPPDTIRWTLFRCSLRR